MLQYCRLNVSRLHRCCRGIEKRCHNHRGSGVSLREYTMKNRNYQVGTAAGDHVKDRKNGVAGIYLTVISPILLLITAKYDTLSGHGEKH